MPKEAHTSWSAHHNTPAELAVLFDFLNTLDERSFGKHRPADELGAPALLAAWLADHDLVAAGTTAGAEDLRLARELRDVLRQCAVANRLGETEAMDPAGLFDALPLRATLATAGGVRLTAAATGVPGALATLLASAVWATANGSWSRIKMCAAQDCRIVFYDHSKPRNGRWCDTLDCGNRVKTRSYRQRRQSRPSAVG